MARVLACDTHATFYNLCSTIDHHDPSGLLGPLVERLLGPVVVGLGLLILGRVLRSFLERTIVRAGGDPQVRSLVHNVVTAGTYAFAVLAALVAAGLDLSVLLTFGGLASLAVGLAFQDVLRNLLAGIFLLVEKPFRLGDTITVQDCTGEVRTIQLRTTTLHTGDGRLAVIPNLTAFNAVIVNESAFEKRQFTLGLRLQGDADLGDVMRSVRTVLADCDEVLTQPAPSIEPQLDDDAAMLQCHYWLDVRTSEPDAVAAELAQKLWAIASSGADAAASRDRAAAATRGQRSA